MNIPKQISFYLLMNDSTWSWAMGACHKEIFLCLTDWNTSMVSISLFTELVILHNSSLLHYPLVSVEFRVCSYQIHIIQQNLYDTTTFLLHSLTNITVFNWAYFCIINVCLPFFSHFQKIVSYVSEKNSILKINYIHKSEYCRSKMFLAF